MNRMPLTDEELTRIAVEELLKEAELFKKKSEAEFKAIRQKSPMMPVLNRNFLNRTIRDALASNRAAERRRLESQRRAGTDLAGQGPSQKVPRIEDSETSEQSERCETESDSEDERAAESRRKAKKKQKKKKKKKKKRKKDKKHRKDKRDPHNRRRRSRERKYAPPAPTAKDVSRTRRH